MLAEHDFIYDYSDLNLLQTRVQVLKGDYEGMIVEIGGSSLMQWEDKNLFDFEYTLYQYPKNVDKIDRDETFDKFIANIIVGLVDHRRNRPDWKERLDEACDGLNTCSIKIDSKFYINKYRQQPVVSGMMEI
jgi:hypothetical protein